MSMSRFTQKGFFDLGLVPSNYRLSGFTTQGCFVGHKSKVLSSHLYFKICDLSSTMALQRSRESCKIQTLRNATLMVDINNDGTVGTVLSRTQGISREL